MKSSETKLNLLVYEAQTRAKTLLDTLSIGSERISITSPPILPHQDADRYSANQAFKQRVRSIRSKYKLRMILRGHTGQGCSVSSTSYRPPALDLTPWEV